MSYYRHENLIYKSFDRGVVLVTPTSVDLFVLFDIEKLSKFQFFEEISEEEFTAAYEQTLAKLNEAVGKNQLSKN